MAILIDGIKVAQKVRNEVKARATALTAATGIVPTLATVLVGENPASRTYVASKHKACEEVQMHTVGYNLPAEASEEEVLAIIQKLNNDPHVHGILVQLPLPKHINSEKILESIVAEKDVDGFHPVNFGRLGTKSHGHYFVPCTPAGCIRLLEEYGCTFKGKRAVVLGRSNIVGMPASVLLLHRDCTVTVAHSKTENLAAVCREADILVAAVGRAEMVKGDWVKPGAYVIDVGINEPWADHAADANFTIVGSDKPLVGHFASQSEKGHRRIVGYYDPNTKLAYAKNSLPAHLAEDPALEKIYRKYHIVGDVDFAAVEPVAGYITPVPGGVGPMTIAQLLWNTCTGAELLHA